MQIRMKPKDLRLLTRLTELGLRQLNAPVNNRRATVEAIEGEIGTLAALHNDPERLPDEAAVDALDRMVMLRVITLPVRRRRAYIEDLIADRRTRLSEIEAGIRQDRAEGHFQDYTDVRRRLAAGEVDFTDVVDELPYSLQEADALAQSHEST